MKKFDIPAIYKSNIISSIKEARRLKDKLKKDFSPTKLVFSNLEIVLARHFGFCYGVENAVEIAYKTLDENPNKRIFFLSEMIHNPEVNEDLLDRGVKFLMDTSGNKIFDWDTLKPEDIVVVPAFGTTIEIQKKLESLQIDPYKYDTTCPFVEKVWNRATQIGDRGYTVIVHGKPYHEETKATFSHSKAKTPTVIVNDMNEAKILAQYVVGSKPKESFYNDFENQYSDGFDPDIHLKRIGVVNQTTMLASDTQEISDFLKKVILDYNGVDEKAGTAYFANTRDTLCYATNDNQDATHNLLNTQADIAIVVGGYNSSNTMHLVELCETKLPTYFIRNHDSLLNKDTIQHYNIHDKREIISKNYLPAEKKPTILLTCGASCPDAIMEAVLLQLVEFYHNSNELESVIKQVTKN